MSLETKKTLNDDTITEVQELIEINIDSYNGFRQAADHTADTILEKTFRELAEGRVAQAVELQGLIARNDEEPVTEGSLAGRVHRGIMDWREAFGGGPSSVLKEAKRGEDYIKAKYEAALTQTAGSAVTDVLNRQYAAVKKDRDRVRALSDAIASS